MDFIDQHKMATKVKRGVNWTSDETLALVGLVAEKRKLLVGKFAYGVSKKQKADAWHYIVSAINTQFPTESRTRENVEKKWSNLSSKSRELYSQFQRESQKTGRHSYNQINAIIPPPPHLSKESVVLILSILKYIIVYISR